MPIEINDSVLTETHDIRSTHEEVVQLEPCLVIADITGIFILLFHFYHSLNLAGNIMMIASANGCNMIGINATYEKHQEICLHLLSTRGLTGCFCLCWEVFRR